LALQVDINQIFLQPQLKILLYRHSLREVLDAPNVMNMIKDTKAAQEVL
jgi:hypothetical protein